ncbi:MAG TPA: universal stress protein [Bacteroidia bacterium]|nr:universal stress protein [Bacteroidia bacterium]
MRPILVATDYSPAANHAADYAAQLAKATGARLELFHSWMTPVIGGETLAVPYPIIDLEDSQKKAIVNEGIRLEKKWSIQVTPTETVGFAVDEIENFCQQVKPSFVVFGMRHTDPIEQIFGSTVTAFIKRDKFPVLVVSERAKFKVPKKILLATDLVTKAGWHELDMLKELAAQFNSVIHIMNAISEKVEHIEISNSAAGHRLEKVLKDYPHSWHYESDGDILHSVYKICDEIHADWIAAIPHRMNWIQRLFNKSTTRGLAFNSNIPLLVLPEHHTEL